MVSTYSNIIVSASTSTLKFVVMSFALACLPLLPSIIAFYYVSNEEVHRTIGTLLPIAIFGYFLTSSLIPVIGEYTKKRGLSGKDLGKKGTPNESRDIPEALGIVSGTVFLICAIATQLLFAKNLEQLTIFNSALFSICFMIFLGFTDDTLDLKWRYKIFLPTIASLPLLVAYSGSTSLFVPSAFRGLFMTGEHLTPLGAILDLFVTVDTQAYGAIIDLGGVFLLFMGLLAVFCTNAINIYAGINGLECGQSYIIACSILFFKLYELSFAPLTDDRLFSLVFIIPFLATALGLLRHNWFPADVFVGDTFCYFAGMTFAVVGIHGHFSKTLLLLFIPQILNFLYSIPQLFKIIPCPRHRLPRADPTTHLLHCSTFPCKSSEYKLFKVRADDTECPNCTLICLVLRIFGPMSERNLCMTLLAIQCVNTILVFVIRYYVFGEQV